MQVMKPYVSWFANININGQRVKVKVDWSTLYQYSLAEYSIPWKSYSEGTIHHHGVAKLQCTAVSPKGRFDFYVVDTKAPPILSLQASTGLSLMQKGPSHLLSVEAVTSVTSPQPDLSLDKVKADYADLFTGLGIFDTPH